MSKTKTNEADVREEVAAPLLNLLGYKRGTENDIWREFPLSYDRHFLGTKKKTDPVLRGRADYVMIVLGAGRWVLEVKAPHEEITKDAIDQAISYARHPHVSGVYSAILNGKRLVLYHNTQSSQDRPLLELDVTTPELLAEQLQGTLAPSSMRRDCRLPIIDLGKPLAEGLRSYADVKSGSLTYSEVNWTCNFPLPEEASARVNEMCRRLVSFRSQITGGKVWRNDEGRIKAILNWASIHDDMLKFMQDKHLQDAEYISLDNVISTNPDQPTIFDVTKKIDINEGDKLFDIVRWQTEIAGITANMTYRGQAMGLIEKNVFSGEFQTEYESTYPSIPGVKLIMAAHGKFEVMLDDR